MKKKAERQILAVKPSATEEELTAVFEQEVRALVYVLGPVDSMFTRSRCFDVKWKRSESCCVLSFGAHGSLGLS